MVGRECFTDKKHKKTVELGLKRVPLVVSVPKILCWAAEESELGDILPSKKREGDEMI